MTKESAPDKTFREDEIVLLRHYDKKNQSWVTTSYPKIGGRLRLAHEDNETLTITTDIIKCQDEIAIVKAVVVTAKGEFPGLGMASADRDKLIAPAILELAETRAIARSLRFAGYGVEYCSAEEISHLENGHLKPEDDALKAPDGSEPEEGSARKQNKDKEDGNGDSQSRLTNKQLKYIVSLGKNLEMGSKELDRESIKAYGVKIAHLTMKDASAFIETLKTQET